jgi:hypothetical protein
MRTNTFNQGLGLMREMAFSGEGGGSCYSFVRSRLKGVVIKHWSYGDTLAFCTSVIRRAVAVSRSLSEVYEPFVCRSQ